MFEKQSELVLFSGTIESISERSLRTLTIEKRFRSYGVTNYHGSFVTISGQEFFFFNAKYLSVGDEIRVSYLPKSRIVLEYKRLDAQKAVNRNDKIYAIRADVMNRSPDVEVIFEFNGTRTRPAIDGYRPAHLVTDDHLTTGIHHYYEVESVPPDGTAKGTITFLSPEAYPHCLWIGKKINIQEGARIVGYATVTEIYNPLLLSKN
ncbi:MAG: hypothetical protein J1E60_05200 [Christensenellaceae bacterium]|nr:hypothetical protein [Christensenellaceae bacterium]